MHPEVGQSCPVAGFRLGELGGPSLLPLVDPRARLQPLDVETRQVTAAAGLEDALGACVRIEETQPQGQSGIRKCELAM